MPRKSSRDALRDYLQADHDRWRLLARNGLFRKDLAEYLNKCGTALYRGWPLSKRQTNRRGNKDQRLRDLYLSKWGVDRVPDIELWQEDEFVITIKGLERWYQAAREENGEFTIGVWYPAYMTGIRKGPRPDQMYVEFLLDVSIPVDQLTAVLEKELRHWLWKEYGEHVRGKRQNLGFHLEVFDLLHVPGNGKKLTFADIARKLRRKPSTIRDAYFSACKRIGLIDHKSKPVPINECPDTRCRNAQSLDDFCKAHKVYVDQ